MTINQIINVEIIHGESPPVTEPVGLQEMKNYLRLEDFENGGDSPSDEFDFDDDLIEDMITEARIWGEQFIGGKDYMHSILPRDIEVVLLNQGGDIRIPGPATSDILIADQDGNEITGAKFIGGKWPKLCTTYCHNVVLSYSIGYTSAPKWFVNAIKAYVAWAYQHRGDEIDLKGNPQRAIAILNSYVKIEAWG